MTKVNAMMFPDGAEPDTNQSETDAATTKPAPASARSKPAVTSPNTTKTNTAPSPQRLDLDALRLTQDFDRDLGVKKALITVPIRKPSRQVFVRVHSDESYRFPTYVLELKEEQELYIVHPSLRAELLGELVPKILYTTIDRQGNVFLWPVRLPGSDGRLDEWNQSAHDAAEMAMEKWISVRSNRSLGAYEVFEAEGDLPEPEWPDKPFQDLLDIAFKKRIIDDIDHAVIRRLRGQS